MSPPGSLWSTQEASGEPQTVAWNVLKINSSSQEPPRQRDLASREPIIAFRKLKTMVSDNIIFFTLSVVKVAPQARPKTR